MSNSTVTRNNKGWLCSALSILLFLLLCQLSSFSQDTTAKKPPPVHDSIPKTQDSPPKTDTLKKTDSPQKIDSIPPDTTRKLNLPPGSTPIAPLDPNDTVKVKLKNMPATSGTPSDTSLPAGKDTGKLIKVSGDISLGSGVTDLSGTSVQIKGSDKAVPTDSAGHYTISAPAGAVLVFSHIGYQTVEQGVNGKGLIDVSLSKEANTLEQVTVSYGKQLKRDLTGAINKVDASAVADVPAAEFGQKLQGKVSGVQIQQTSGLPGNNIVFRIRGAASLSSGNQPLIVVDGQPLNSDATGGTGDINLIAPDEIESYSVLKDAAATSLYGSRASNGVILITTKTAKIGKSSVSANVYYGLQTVPHRGRPDLMNAHEFATYMNGFYQDQILNEGGGPHNLTAVPADYANPDQYGAGTDWYGALLRTAPMENYSVNYSVGADKVSSSTTMNYFNQDGVVYNTGTKRYAFRSNTEYRPIERLKLGLNLAPAYQIDHNTRGGTLALNGNRQVVAGSELSSPLISPYKSPGVWNLNTTSTYMYTLPNYLQQAKIMDNDQTNFSFLGNAYIDLEIIHGLHAKSTINGDILSQDYNAYYGTNFGYFGVAPPRPQSSSQAVNNSNNTYTWTNENLLTYSTNFGNHSLDVLAGYSTQKSYESLRSITGNGFATDETPWISAASSTTGTSNSTSWTIVSAFARINYDYKKRYYISGTIRNDGSSRFGESKKYGTFPSVSAAWVASDEKFFPKIGFLSFLKFRGSYGLTGNFNIGNYTQTSLLSPTNYVLSGNTTLGESITTLGNPNLTWETSKQLDLGADLTLLHGRINISYDYYMKHTEDMLAPLPIPYASGYGSIQYNDGTFKIWGHDIQISTENIKGRNFTWSTDFNISFNDNKVISLVNNTPIGGTNTYSDYNRTQEGHRIGELYGYVFEGVYMNQSDFDKYPKYSTSVPGSARMKDVNGDDTIDINDRTFLGRTNPKFIYGMTNNFTFKNFDLGIIVAGQVGNYIMNTNKQNTQNLDGVFNVEKEMANRWRSPSQPGDGKVPSTRSGSTELYRLVNSNWVSPGDYLAVKNITLGYTFGQKTLHYIKGIRIYGSIQNAFMFTKYPGQNPEVNDNKDNQTAAGLDNGSYPIPRVVMFGANVNF